jgi:pSer/pThr/pTyr-binding forkhead associated (FHA) protein
MNRLLLEWVEAERVRQQTIADQQSTKTPGTFRIGRDPAQCDLVLQHPTVSKQHIEIFFVPQPQGFYLRNLRETNPPLVNQQRVTQNPVALQPGATIRLGELDLTVKEVQIVTELAPAGLSVPVASPSPVPAPRLSRTPDLSAPVAQPGVELSYGLQCPKCHRVSPYEHLHIGCAWCGTSLAAAHSALIVPDR